MIQWLESVIFDHLIQFLTELSFYMHNSFNEKMTKRYYKNFDKGKFKAKLGKISWQKHYNDPDSNISMENFLNFVVRHVVRKTCSL